MLFRSNELKEKNEELNKSLEELLKQKEKYEKKQYNDIGIETEFNGSNAINKLVPSKILKTEYIKLLKEIKNEQTEIESKKQIIGDLNKLTDRLSKTSQQIPSSIMKRKGNKSCQSMTSLDFNTLTVFSNPKTRTRATSRLGQSTRKDKKKIRSTNITAPRTERSIYNNANKRERGTKSEIFNQTKGCLKRNRPHPYSTDTQGIKLPQSLENQKKNTQSLLRIASKVLNQKNNFYFI